MQVIDIAEQYTRFPGGRYPEDGRGNGTDFREKFLIPVLNQGDHAKVILDGAIGYPSSFLDEAFAGLVREHGYTAKIIFDTFIFVATRPGFKRYIDLIESYVKSAEKMIAH